MARSIRVAQDEGGMGREGRTERTAARETEVGAGGLGNLPMLEVGMESDRDSAVDAESAGAVVVQFGDAYGDTVPNSHAARVKKPNRLALLPAGGSG